VLARARVVTVSSITHRSARIEDPKVGVKGYLINKVNACHLPRKTRLQWYVAYKQVEIRKFCLMNATHFRGFSPSGKTSSTTKKLSLPTSCLPMSCKYVQNASCFASCILYHVCVYTKFQCCNLYTRMCTRLRTSFRAKTLKHTRIQTHRRTIICNAAYVPHLPKNANSTHSLMWFHHSVGWVHEA
jgi:hypothetical protein